MPGHPPDSRPRPAAPGEDAPPPVKDSVALFARGLQQYLEARSELLAIESREAARLAVRKAIVGGAVASFTFFAYGLVLCAAVSLAGRWLESSFPRVFDKIGWECAALIIGLLHVVAGIVFLTALRRKSDRPLFEITRREFQKDRQWLIEQQTEREKTS